MSVKHDAFKQVRLDPKTHEALFLIQKDCDWPVSLNVLANYAIMHGLSRTRQAFITRKSKP